LILYSLGIPHVGKETANLISRSFPTADSLQRASLDSLKQIGQIGEVTSKSVWNFFNQQETRLLLLELQQHLPFMNQEQKVFNPLVVHKILNENIPPEWVGKCFVFTGKMKAFSRAEAQEYASRFGSFKAQIDKSVHFLVMSDEGTENNKSHKAEALGIKVLSETEFCNVIYKVYGARS